MKSALVLLLFTAVLAQAQEISGPVLSDSVPDERTLAEQQESLSPIATLSPLSPSVPFAPYAPNRPSSPVQPLSPSQLMVGAGTTSTSVSSNVSQESTTMLQSPGSAGALSARLLETVQAVTSRLDGISISVGGAGFR